MLDESTAELAKMEFSPMLSTIEANFKIKRPVPLNTSLRIECKVTSLIKINHHRTMALLESLTVSASVLMMPCISHTISGCMPVSPCCSQEIGKRLNCLLVEKPLLVALEHGKL